MKNHHSTTPVLITFDNAPAVNIPPQDVPPVTPRRSSSIAIVFFVAALAFILLSRSVGAGPLAFNLFGAFDFLMGAGLWKQMPFLMWAFWGMVFGAALGFWLDAPLYGLRRQRWLFVVAPLVLLCGSAAYIRLRQLPLPIAPDPVAPPPPPLPAPNFAGTWDTGQWGTMTLTQDENHVFGNYTYSGGVIEGTTAPLPGGALRLNYKWRNQSGGANGVGYFDLAPGAQSFQGEWVEGQSLNGNGREWTGKRTGAPKQPDTFTGLWDTEWGQMRLHQGVKTVTGTYEYGRGTIQGNLDGKTLRFRWVNRVTGETGVGKFTLELYGQTFQGTWNKSNNADLPGEAWTGRRLNTSE